jgi:hypothetical protein
MLNKAIVKSLLVSIPVVFGVSLAHGADGKTYPATICQYWTAPENANRGRMIVSQFGFVGNDAEASRRLGVVCPLIRDSQRSGIERIFVRAEDENCSSTTLSAGQACQTPSECTFRVMHSNGRTIRNGNGDIRQLVTHGSPQPAGPAILFANWEGISVPDFTNAESTSQGSTFVLFCQIAPGARINSIYVGEGTD